MFPAWTSRPEPVGRAEAKGPPAALRVSVERVSLWLCTVLAVLVLAHVTGLVLKYGLGYSSARGFIRLFSFGVERNVPTWFSALLLLASSCLLATIALVEKGRGRGWVARWLGLSAVFHFLACDELLEIHEKVSLALGSDGVAGGLLHYSWVVPYAAFAALVLVLYLPFLRRLPRRTRRLFLLAGAVFVGAALGLEMVEGVVDRLLTPDNWYTRGLILLEESAEVAGVIIFIHACLAHLQESSREIEVRVVR